MNHNAASIEAARALLSTLEARLSHGVDEAATLRLSVTPEARGAFLGAERRLRKASALVSIAREELNTAVRNLKPAPERPGPRAPERPGQGIGSPTHLFLPDWRPRGPGGSAA